MATIELIPIACNEKECTYENMITNVENITWKDKRPIKKANQS